TGTLVLLVMRMLGEMALALPSVRSFTEFARAGLGPWAGFVAGWLYWYFWIIVVPVEAIAGARILHDWLGLPAWILGLALMGIMTAVNLMSARSYGEFEFWFASIKVAAIIVFIALTAAFVCGLSSPTGPTFSNLTAYGGFMPKGLLSVLAGAVTVYFSLTGAEITTIAAAESQEPARAVARMSTSVILRILTFYVGSVLLIVTAVPWVQVRPGESPFTLVLNTMHFKWASLAMSAIILTAVLSCLNSAFYVCSRVLFVLAEHGDAPQWLVQLNTRRVPTRSVWMGSLAGVLGILAAITSPQPVFAFLVNASGARGGGRRLPHRGRAAPLARRDPGARRAGCGSLMSTPAAFTRRQFVLTAAAVGGALVLGVALQRRRRRLMPGGGARARGALNAYVRIEPSNRITLVMPKVEMGQGTFTSLPMLIAEELEVDLGAVVVEAAPPHPAVYGFAVDPAAPEGIERDQSTGTSLSIIQCWTPLRQAGAAARLMLIQAAAKRWRVPIDTCHAQRGEVIHAPSGRRLSYGELAAAAAALPVPAAPPLKAAQDFRLIGRATPRRDTPQKVDGSAVFGIDARPPNSKAALIALSP